MPYKQSTDFLGLRKATSGELSIIRSLCKLPKDKDELKSILSYLTDNRHYISVIAACAAEIKERFYPIQVCVILEIVNNKPIISVSAESEEIDVQDTLDDFFSEWYDPISFDLGAIRFDAQENWASMRYQMSELKKIELLNKSLPPKRAIAF